ncbi:MAG: hypothetical protein MI673_06580 [Thiotrichales bacterium]|nr:hypothetical protein [Thiotrichales bacterium]
MIPVHNFQHGIKKFYLSIVACTGLVFSNPALWAESAQIAENFFQEGLQAYEEDDYERAIKSLEKATGHDRNQSRYFHFLGKSYGKLASESNWFRAMDLSQKTLKALEQAVHLDSNNHQAIIDLIKFYRQAPGFLGGDNKKADELEKQLAEKTIRQTDVGR